MNNSPRASTSDEQRHSLTSKLAFLLNCIVSLLPFRKLTNNHLKLIDNPNKCVIRTKIKYKII